MNKKKYFILIFLIKIYFFVCYLANVNDFGFDNMINGVIRNVTDGKTSFYKILTFFGSGIFLSLCCVLLLIFVKDNSKRIMIVANLVIVSLFSNFVLKPIFHRDRPIDMIVSENGYSFPSSHAFIATAFYGLLIYFVYKSNLSCRIKILFISCLSLVIFGIGVSRVYLGVHYPTDVIGGFVGGVIYLICMLKLFYLVKGVDYEKK